MYSLSSTVISNTSIRNATSLCFDNYNNLIFDISNSQFVILNPLTFSTFLQTLNISHFLKYLKTYVVQYFILICNNCKNINPEIRGLNR
jgi:hypothetical protein